MDLPSKKLVSEDALLMELRGHIQRFKEKYPLDTKWVLLGPQDGDPPMGQWKGIYSIADQVVAMSKYGQQVYKNFFNIEAPCIYHGIDTDMFSPKEKEKQFQDKFILGNFNRNQPRKQPVRTIKAFAKFAKDKDDVLLHMQMDWNDQFGWPIQYFCQLYGVMNKTIRPLQVGMPREQVAQVYNQWDLNINSGGGEGHGICEIEGMACGVPNIAQDYTTSKEFILDGKPSPRGTLIPLKELYWEKMDVAAVQRSAVDVDALAKIYDMYYQNRDILKQHSENARVWAEKHSSMKALQHKWKKLFKEIMNRE